VNENARPDNAALDKTVV